MSNNRVGSTTVPTRGARPARGRGGRRAFTLVELLVVIGIIAVLAGILIPVVNRVRQQAYAANTQAQITALLGVIQAYQGDFNAYPGPLSNMQVNQAMAGVAPGFVLADGTEDQITMSENLVLGLAGGLRRVGATVSYDGKAVGSGPGWLGSTPKKLPAYLSASDTSLVTLPGGVIVGKYTDGNGRPAVDSDIPELVDRFPDPMPLLYLRARRGARSAGNTPSNNPVVTDGTTVARVGQYDLSQIAGYVGGGGGGPIGVGRALAEKEYVNVPAGETKNRPHGLRTVNPIRTTTPTRPDGTADPNYLYPFDLHAALRVSKPDTAKQSDAFIIISAGMDRVYGTRDDITNFGSY